MRRHKSTTSLHRRSDMVFAVAVALGLAAFAWLVITMQGLASDLRAANIARDQLALQVQRLGAKPIAGPPGSRGEPGKGVVGPSGPPGPQGEPGEPAPTITPSPGPTGPPGGDGADSTVPGPMGPSGPSGQDATGAPGRDGRDGIDGKDGADGADGKPPAGWTFTYRGVTYTCHPGNEFDPDNPHYECDASEPNPEPSEPKGPLNLAMDPSRRRW